MKFKPWAGWSDPYGVRFILDKKIFLPLVHQPTITDKALNAQPAPRPPPPTYADILEPEIRQLSHTIYLGVVDFHIRSEGREKKRMRTKE